MTRGIVAAATAGSLISGIIAATAVGGGTAAQATKAETPRTFVVYSSLPLQGPFRPQSRDASRAIQMALDDHGGRVGGHPIRYVSLDDASPETGFPEPATIVQSARIAAKDPDAIAYIGNFTSYASAFSIPILNRAGILQVSPSNTRVGLTRSEGAHQGEPDMYYPTGKRTYGRVIPADHTQAGAVVAYMKEQGCPNVYIVNDREEYGTSVARLVSASASANGVAVLANDGVTRTTNNLRAAARRVGASGAACFFFGGLTFSGAPLLFKSVGRHAPAIKLFGADGVVESAFTTSLGPELEQRVFLTNPTLGRRAYPPRGQKFLSAFKEEFGHYPSPFAIYAYEAMSVVLKAIKIAHEEADGAEGRAAVVKAFFGITKRKSVLGSYAIDADGDTTLTSYGGFRPVDGEAVFDKVLTALVTPPASRTP